MDPFQRFPVELMLCIMRYTDFVGFETLFEVSPFVRNVFRVHCIRITEDALAYCSSTSYDLHRLFRTVTLIRTPSIKFSTFDEYKPCSATAKPLHAWYRTVSLSEAESTLYGMVKIAARIQRQACAVLSKMLDRLCVAGNRTSLLRAGWQKNGLARPSWIEEFRTYRALWTLQVQCDLQQAVSPHSMTEGGSWGGWSWSGSEMLKTVGYSPLLDMPSYWKASTHNLLAPEVQGVAEVLVELGAHCKSRFPIVQRGHFEVCTSVLVFSFMETPKAVDCPVWSTPPVAQHTQSNRLWHLTKRSTRRSTRHRIVQELWTASSGGGDYPSGIDKVRPFRKLGLYLWDDWRMHSMGLVHLPPSGATSTPDGSSLNITDARFTNLQVHKRWLSLIGLPKYRH